MNVTLSKSRGNIGVVGTNITYLVTYLAATLMSDTD